MLKKLATLALLVGLAVCIRHYKMAGAQLPPSDDLLGFPLVHAQVPTDFDELPTGLKGKPNTHDIWVVLTDHGLLLFAGEPNYRKELIDFRDSWGWLDSDMGICRGLFIEPGGLMDPLFKIRKNHPTKVRLVW